MKVDFPANRSGFWFEGSLTMEVSFCGYPLFVQGETKRNTHSLGGSPRKRHPTMGQSRSTEEAIQIPDGLSQNQGAMGGETMDSPQGCSFGLVLRDLRNCGRPFDLPLKPQTVGSSSKRRRATRFKSVAKQEILEAVCQTPPSIVGSLL